MTYRVIQWFQIASLQPDGKISQIKKFSIKIWIKPPYLCLIVINKYVAIVQAGQNPRFRRVNIDGFDSVWSRREFFLCIKISKINIVKNNE